MLSLLTQATIFSSQVKLPEEVQGILETGGRGRLSNASGGRRGSRGGYGGGSYGGGGGGGGYQGRGEGMFQVLTCVRQACTLHGKQAGRSVDWINKRPKLELP